MSRRRDTEIMFGSDSFLDVVANIVGILIILIVIAGVRVSQAPVISAPAAAPVIAAPPMDDESAAPAESETPEVAPIMAGAPPEGEPESLNDPLPLPDLVPPPELVTRSRKLEEEIESLIQGGRSLNESLTHNNRLMSELEQRLATAKSLLAERNQELKSIQAKGDEEKRDLELARRTIARLLAQIKDEEQKAAPVEKLEHRITPVSRTVMGKELHFRLDKNRVAEVPVEALINRLKDHIERRKDWLIKTRQHKGLVGPINGFNMEYIIGVDTITGLEELRTGHGGYRLNMRWWEIQPENNLRGETETEALTQGSRFYQALLEADPDTTLTFWVYPDSYPIFRKLQKFAHEHGFPVAARPLPKGIPIAGAPNGSRSASQ